AATGKNPDQALPVGEDVLFRYFAEQGSVTIDKQSGPGLAQKRNEFTAALQRENRNVWFRHNAGFAVLGVVLMVLMLIGMVALDVLEPAWLVAAFVGGIFAAVIGSILFNALRTGGWQRYLTIVIVGVFAFNFAGGLIETF